MRPVFVYNLTSNSLVINETIVITSSAAQAIYSKQKFITITGEVEEKSCSKVPLLSIQVWLRLRRRPQKFIQILARDALWNIYSFGRHVYFLPQRDLGNYLADFADEVGLNELFLPGELFLGRLNEQRQC